MMAQAVGAVGVWALFSESRFFCYVLEHLG